MQHIYVLDFVMQENPFHFHCLAHTRHGKECILATPTKVTFWIACCICVQLQNVNGPAKGTKWAQKTPYHKITYILSNKLFTFCKL